MSNFVKCLTIQDLEFVKTRVAECIKLVRTYRKITDCYISDFFSNNHWDEIPDDWKKPLKEMETKDYAWILNNDAHVVPQPKIILPQSLIEFQKKVSLLPLSRIPVDLDEVLQNDVFSSKDNINQKTRKGTAIKMPSAKAEIKYGQYLPLCSCFRQHVKPKKQHEILNLGKVVDYLGHHTMCSHVVDVGAGLGHLSRLLTFKHHLRVTTVEAVGCHAGKAEKFDKSIKSSIENCKKKRKHTGETISNAEAASCDIQSAIQHQIKSNLPDHVTCVIQPNASVQNFIDIVHKSMSNQSGSISNSPSANSTTYKNCEEHEEQSYVINSFSSGNSDDTLSEQDKTYPEVKMQDTPSEQDKTYPEVKMQEKQFIMTGLHACGDLSCTMLKVFAESADIVGCALVACCYHKVTCSELGTENRKEDEYPMSDFVKGLPDSHLGFEDRASACHFADMFRTRLLDENQKLKLKSHGYRAALQPLILKRKPDFAKGSSRVTVKLSDDMPFSDYAEKALSRLKLDATLSHEEKALAETEHLPLWKDVLALYTIRLSFAPVMETILLLDRMVYLYERGIPSCLLPIFDPELSPRNFVLLACK